MTRDAQGYDPDETVRIDDNPFWDATDAAHPAWWRGNDAGVQAVVERLTRTLDGGDTGSGVFGYPPLTKLRDRILRLMTAASRTTGTTASRVSVRPVPPVQQDKS